MYQINSRTDFAQNSKPSTTPVGAIKHTHLGNLLKWERIYVV